MGSKKQTLAFRAEAQRWYITVLEQRIAELQRERDEARERSQVYAWRWSILAGGAPPKVSGNE